MVCNFQKNKSKCKENRQTCNRYVDRSSRQLYNCNDYRSKEGSALGKNIVDAKIFSRILRRNNFGIIRPRQRLNRSLKASHSKCQNRKVHQRPQCQRIEADDKIACDADQNQGYRIFFPRQFCKNRDPPKATTCVASRKTTCPTVFRFRSVPMLMQLSMIVPTPSI